MLQTGLQKWRLKGRMGWGWRVGWEGSHLLALGRTMSSVLFGFGSGQAPMVGGRM